MRNKWIALCLALWILVLLPVQVFGQEVDPDKRGSASVSLVSPDGEQPMEGAEFSVYHVATVEDVDGSLLYTYTGAFAGCGVALDDPELAEKLDAYVSDKAIPAEKITCDAQGNAVCRNLQLGLYLFKQTGMVSGFAPCVSFLVTVPMETEAGMVYDVDASPKTDVLRLINLTIRKVWNTDQSTKIPESVTVELLCNGNVVKVVELNRDNDWYTTCADMPENDGYSINEVDIPNGFTATYSQTGFDFTVTNTASLAQTGQLVWPVPVLALAGICFLMLGGVLLRKPGRGHA